MQRIEFSQTFEWSQWVLNAPDPLTMWHKLRGSYEHHNLTIQRNIKNEC